MKKVITAFLCCLFSISVFAVDLTLKVTPGAIIPLDDYMSPGFNTFVSADIDLFNFLTFGVEGSFTTEKPKGLDSPVSFLGIGADLGVYYNPLSRLYLGAGGSFGVNQINTTLDYKTQTGMGLNFRGYGEVGFRVNPELTLCATGGYQSYLIVGSEPILSGVTAGVSIRYTLPLGKSSSSAFGINLVQEDSALPLFMSAYKVCPLGTLVLTNKEGAEIRNVHVSFRAGKYTSSTFESAHLNRINKHSSEEIPLYVDFSPEILKFSENGKISGEIIVDYEILGAKKQSVQNVVLSVYNRNAFYWVDPSSISAFVSSNTPEVLSFAKYVAGIVNKLSYSGMNKSIQTAAGMLEAIRLSGIKYSDDKMTPYLEYHNGVELDSVQYPLQTMNCLSGDYDDLGILLASCLESVNVQTGFMTTSDDFIVLVNMGVSPKSAGLHVADTNSLIMTEDEAWFGLSMKEMSKGFAASRNAGANAIKAVLDGTELNCEFVFNETSWETYPPAIFTGSGTDFENPKSSVLEAEIKKAIQDYISYDLEPLINQAKKAGDTSKLGMALVRAGRYTEAKTQFAKLNTLAAMNNTANILLLERNYDACIAQYKKVLDKDPQNKNATKGLERVNQMMGL